jgi:CRISPR-associated protein Csb2
MAACYEAKIGAPGLDVLRWLETLAPPQLYASEATARTAAAVFVRVNDAPEGKRLPEERLKQARHFPCVVPEAPRVYMIWPDAQPQRMQRQVLAHLASHVPYLGSARSLVDVSLCPHPPSPNWLPAEPGEIVLRLPMPGRVDELNTRFDLGLRPTPGRLQPYRRADRQPATSPPQSHFGDMMILRQTRGPSLPLPATLTLTEALRKAMMRVAGDEAPAWLHGHGEADHLAWAPLPFVGHPHADGHLLGAALLFPSHLTLAERLPCLASLARIDRVRLPDGRDWGFTAEGDSRPLALQPATWTRASRTWRTVTPIVLDRYPKPKRGLDEAAIIRQACEHIGLPAPATVSPHRFSDVAGVPPSYAFHVHRAGKSRRVYTHATLQFAIPVQGPIVLGAARYFGLGLCRPVHEAILEDLHAS